jgi:hypothetical protein
MTRPALMRARDSEHRYRGAMAHITGHIRIAAPVGQVFDMVADSRNEPSFNPAMTGVELLTAPPIGLGTRFRSRMGRQAWRCSSSSPSSIARTGSDRGRRAR